MSISKYELAKALEISKHYWDDQYWDMVESDKLLDFVNQIVKNLTIPDVSGSVLYKGYKITESLQGFDVNVWDGEEWRLLFVKPDVDICKDFIDRFLKTDR